MYEFIDVEIEGGLKAGKTDTFDEVKKSSMKRQVKAGASSNTSCT